MITRNEILPEFFDQDVYDDNGFLRIEDLDKMRAEKNREIKITE